MTLIPGNLTEVNTKIQETLVFNFIKQMKEGINITYFV